MISTTPQANEGLHTRAIAAWVAANSKPVVRPVWSILDWDRIERMTELYKAGYTLAQTRAILDGKMCAICLACHGPKACAELRVELMKEAS